MSILNLATDTTVLFYKVTYTILPSLMECKCTHPLSNVVSAFQVNIYSHDVTIPFRLLVHLVDINDNEY